MFRGGYPLYIAPCESIWVKAAKRRLQTDLYACVHRDNLHDIALAGSPLAVRQD